MASVFPDYHVSLPAGRLVRGSAREVLLSSCCVNYQQRRLQDSGVESWHIHSGSRSVCCTLLGPSTGGRLRAGAPSFPPFLPYHTHSSLPHRLELPHRRSHHQPPSAFILFYFLSATHGLPIDFDPRISVSRDRSLSRPGGGDRDVCIFPLCACERETDERKSARCNKCGVRDDRACDLMFSPLRFLSLSLALSFFALAAVSGRSLSVATGFFNVSLVAGCLSSVTGLKAAVVAFSMAHSTLTTLLSHGCSLCRIAQSVAS